MTSLVAVVHDNPGRRGAQVLAAARRPRELTRNDFEQRFLALLDRHGFPRPRVNTQIEGYEVDFAWPEAKLVVETDGYAASRSCG